MCVCLCVCVCVCVCVSVFIYLSSDLSIKIDIIEKKENQYVYSIIKLFRPLIDGLFR